MAHPVQCAGVSLNAGQHSNGKYFVVSFFAVFTVRAQLAVTVGDKSFSLRSVDVAAGGGKKPTPKPKLTHAKKKKLRGTAGLQQASWDCEHPVKWMSVNLNGGLQGGFAPPSLVRLFTAASFRLSTVDSLRLNAAASSCLYSVDSLRFPRRLHSAFSQWLRSAFQQRLRSPFHCGFDPPVNGGFAPPFQGFVLPNHGGFVLSFKGGFVPPLHGGFAPPFYGDFAPPLHGGFVPPLHGGFAPPSLGGFISV